MITAPVHPENPQILSDLPPGTIVIFSLKGVTVTVPISDDPQGRVIEFRMERNSSLPWTEEYGKIPDPAEKVHRW